MRYKILGAFATLAAITACGDLTSINQNPNGPVDVPPPSILPSVIQTLVGGVNGVNSLNVRGGGLWVQYYSEIQYRDEDKYIVRSGTSGGWTLYNGAAEDAQRMIQKGTTANAPNWTAVGRILKSYTFSVMTDAMGDLPYSQAFKGDTVLHPVYDTQKSIYDSLFASLTLAGSEIDLGAAAVGFPSGDLMYGGNMAKWGRFANSLRLRLAMHLTQVDPAKAQSQAAAAVTAGVFASSTDNAQLMYLASSPNRNPIYNDARGRDDYGMSKTFVDSLTSWSDPRLPVFAQLNKDTIVANRKYQGLSNGLNDGEGPSLFYISRIGAFWRETPNAPMHLLTYSEVLFLEAEAAERGWIPGSAATLYGNAIRASFAQYGITDTVKINAYLARPQVVYTPGGAGLAQIAYQKWVSLFMQGMESWTEVRRTGIPAIVPGPRAVLASMPERLPYDDNESVLNKANLDAAVANQGFSAGNDITTPLWFTGR
jgi:hypothetical protein